MPGPANPLTSTTTYNLPYWPLVGPYNVGSSTVVDTPPPLPSPAGKWFVTSITLTFNRIDPVGRSGTIQVRVLTPQGTPGPTGIALSNGYQLSDTASYSISAGQNSFTGTRTFTLPQDIAPSATQTSPSSGTVSVVVDGNVGENETGCLIAVTRTWVPTMPSLILQPLPK